MHPYSEVNSLVIKVTGMVIFWAQSHQFHDEHYCFVLNIQNIKKKYESQKRMKCLTICSHQIISYLYYRRRSLIVHILYLTDYGKVIEMTLA